MSIWNRLAGRPRVDPVKQVLIELLKTQDFAFDVLGILGLERRYEVVCGADKLYLNVLAFGADCAEKIAELERLRERDGTAAQILAWKGCEPRLNGHPYILSDRVI